MDNIHQITQNFNAQGVLADALPFFSRNDACDVSEAITAVLRAAGFKDDHARTILAALAEANGRTTEFSVFSAALGSRMKNKLDPFVEGKELERRGKADSQRWRRAIESLNRDQDETGFYFVIFKRGGNDRGRNSPSKMTVDVETFVNTVRLARHRDDCGTNRKFAFEEAAKTVLQTKTQQVIRRLPPEKMSEEDKLNRLEKTIINSARGFARRAAAQGLDLEALEKVVLDKIRLAFYQEMAGLQIETPQATAEVDTLSVKEVSTSSNLSAPPPVLIKEERNTGGGANGASVTLEAFESVGASVFEVTLKDEVAGKATSYETLDSFSLKKHLRGFVERTEQGAESLIIRPRGGALIQMDDCSLEVVQRLEPFAFLIFETSPSNYQVWLALPEGTSEEELKALRSRLLTGLKQTGANGGAYGAMRWPGSINRKPSRGSFRVRLHRVDLSAYCKAVELEAAGLLAPQTSTPEPAIVKPRDVRFPVGSKVFPSYDKCLAEKGGDRSKADASFLKLCNLRGFSMSEATAELETVSERAQEERRRGRNNYVRRTWDYVTSH